VKLRVTDVTKFFVLFFKNLPQSVVVCACHHSYAGSLRKRITVQAGLGKETKNKQINKQKTS
jgi:hypothetical protein